MNKLTEKLLSQGYTKESPPDGYCDWNDFYGGWTYSREQMKSIFVETPCGLIGKASEICGNGSMSFNGVDWTLENSNYCIHCPLESPECARIDPLLQPTFAPFAMCNTHITDREGDTIQAAYQVREEKARCEIDAYLVAHPRQCDRQMRRDVRTGEIFTWYDPLDCARNGCIYCRMLGRELSQKKVNVYYDLAITTKEPDIGMIPGGLKTTKIKGKKFLPKPVSEDIAKRITLDIINEQLGHTQEISRAEHFSEYHGVYFKRETSNLVIARREARDLEQDLMDIRDGISVTHASDQERQGKEAKRDRAAARTEARKRRVIKAMSTGNVSEVDKNRFEKLRRKGLVGYEDIEPEKPKPKQIDFFEMMYTGPTSQMARGQTLYDVYASGQLMLGDGGDKNEC